MRLLLIMVATLNTTRLGRCKLFKTCGIDGISLLVLSAMRHYLIGVCAHKVAFETVEM